MSLIDSCKINNLEEVKHWLATGANVNAVDGHGRTALWWAVEGHVECTTVLINAKADVNKADEDGETPLHQASFNDRVECVRVLIHHKANVNASNKYGNSPLHFAYRMACVQILVAAGAERDKPNNGGYTPLASAIVQYHPKIAKFLLHLGAKMKNVHKNVQVPSWMTDMIAKRQLIMSFTLALMGLLKRRLGISKDVSHLIALYFWRMRLK